MPYSLSNGANQVPAARTDRHGSIASQVHNFRTHNTQIASGKRVSRSSPAAPPWTSKQMNLVKYKITRNFFRQGLNSTVFYLDQPGLNGYNWFGY
jgi:hypothetical protein